MYMTLEHRKSFYPFNFKPFLFVWNILENIFCRVFAKHFILLGDSKLQCQKKRTFEPFWILSIFKDIPGTCRSPVMSVDNINVFRFVMVKNQLLCDRSLWLWIKLKDFFPLLFTNRVQKSPPASEEELHPIMRKNTRIFGHFRVWLSAAAGESLYRLTATSWRFFTKNECSLSLWTRMLLQAELKVNTRDTLQLNSLETFSAKVLMGDFIATIKCIFYTFLVLSYFTTKVFSCFTLVT